MEASQLPQLVCSWVSQGNISRKQVYFKISFIVCQFIKEIRVQGETIIITSQIPWLHINCWNQLQVILYLKCLHVFLQSFKRPFFPSFFHAATFLLVSFVTDVITVSVIMTFLGNSCSLEYTSCISLLIRLFIVVKHPDFMLLCIKHPNKVIM